LQTKKRLLFIILIIFEMGRGWIVSLLLLIISFFPQHCITKEC
jgi:hypothetical protein